jgi:hypothetical protein
MTFIRSKNGKSPVPPTTIIIFPFYKYLIPNPLPNNPLTFEIIY